MSAHEPAEAEADGSHRYGFGPPHVYVTPSFTNVLPSRLVAQPAPGVPAPASPGSKLVSGVGEFTAGVGMTLTCAPGVGDGAGVPSPEHAAIPNASPLTRAALINVDGNLIGASSYTDATGRPAQHGSTIQGWRNPKPVAAQHNPISRLRCSARESGRLAG